MPFPRPSRIADAWTDLRRFVAQRRRHEAVFLAAAIALTAGMAYAIYDKLSVKPEWKPPEIVYVKQWPADRSLVQVRAQLAKDAPIEAAQRKAEADAAREKREAYQRLAKRLGIE